MAVLSQIPEEVIIKILEHTTIQKSILFSATCKSYRGLYKEIRILNVSDDCIIKFDEISRHFKGEIEEMNVVLSKKIRDTTVFGKLLDKWLIFCKVKRVQCLRIQGFNRNLPNNRLFIPFYPDSIWDQPFLTSLDLGSPSQRFSDMIFFMVNFNNLTRLQVTVLDYASWWEVWEVVMRCPCLKDLSLSIMSDSSMANGQVLRISNYNLRVFQLKELNLDKYTNFITIEIDSPNLEQLHIVFTLNQVYDIRWINEPQNGLKVQSLFPSPRKTFKG